MVQCIRCVETLSALLKPHKPLRLRKSSILCIFETPRFRVLRLVFFGEDFFFWGGGRGRGSFQQYLVLEV